MNTIYGIDRGKLESNASGYSAFPDMITSSQQEIAQISRVILDCLTPIEEKKEEITVSDKLHTAIEALRAIAEPQYKGKYEALYARETARKCLIDIHAGWLQRINI